MDITCFYKKKGDDIIAAYIYIYIYINVFCRWEQPIYIYIHACIFVPLHVYSPIYMGKAPKTSSDERIKKKKERIREKASSRKHAGLYVYI